MGEFRSWPVVRGESRAWASPVHGPSSAIPRPNMACSRRRHRRFTNIFSFVSPWRSIDARSAARLRQGVGPPSSRHAVAGQTRQPDITRNNRTYFEHIPGIFRHRRTREARCVRERRSPDRVPSGPSRREWPVAGSRAVNLVACGIARRRTRRKEWSSCAVSPVAGHGVGNGCHVPYRPSPDTAFKDGRRVQYRRSPDRVRYRPSPDHVSSCPGPCRRHHVSTVVTVGHAERPSSAMPRPHIRL